MTRPAENETEKASVKHPLLWVPTSYFAMGTVYIMVTTSANIIFANLGMSNSDAALYSSLTGFAYSFKFLWGPFVEIYRSKRFFVVTTQFIIAALFAALGFVFQLPNFLVPAVSALMIAAIAGATMDIASDGVYVTSLDKKRQAAFSGVQSMTWSIGPVLATGALVILVGWLAGESKAGPKPETTAYATAWMSVFLGLSVMVTGLAVWHSNFLPAGSKSTEAPASVADAMSTFGKAFITFFQKKYVLNLIAFAFFYRFGLGLLDKVGPLFILDERANGGLGLNNTDLGLLNGLGGTAAFIFGSLVGGFTVARLGMKRSTLLLLVLCLNVPNATFLYLGLAQPDNVYLIGAIVFLEKLGWGFGAVGHMIYMMQQIAPGPYKTAHYAFATGLGLSLCMTLTGLTSGLIQEAVGYRWFFIIVLIAAAPSILVTVFAPFRELTDEEFVAEADERWKNMANEFGLGVAASMGTAFIAYFAVLIPTKSFGTSAYGALVGGLVGLLAALLFVRKEYPKTKSGAAVGFVAAASIAVAIRYLATGGI